MDLPNVKELEKLLKMCRKQGITDLTMGTMSFKFGDLPKDAGAQEEEMDSVLPGVNAEDLAYWSAQDPLSEVNKQ